MSKDQYTHTQCLLFMVDDKCYYGGKQSRRSAGGAQGKVASTRTALPVVEKFVLLPTAFVTGHPKIMTLFRRINIQPVDMQNVSRLFVGEDDLQAIEILLEDNSSASVDPLILVFDYLYKRTIELIFLTTAIQDKWETNTMVVRPAIDDENLKAVKCLLSYGAKIRFKCLKKIGNVGWETCISEGSLLHLAARRGQDVLIRALLDFGLKIDDKDSEGSTPLHYAVSGRSLSAVRILTEAGANVENKDSRGFTALFKTSLPDRFGSFPLNSYLSHNLEQSLLNGSSYDSPQFFEILSLDDDSIVAELEKMLLESGANPNARCHFQVTPYHVAVCFGHLKLMDILYRFGAFARLKGSKGRSVLEYALRRPPVFKFLLESFYPGREFFYEAFAPQGFPLNDCRSIYCRHVAKVIAFNPNLDEIGVDVPRLSATIAVKLGTFMDQCNVEVDRLKRQVFPNMDLSLYNILTRNESQVANAFKNKSVVMMVDSNELKEQYPIYGNILTYHLQKGQLRKSLLEDGIKSCDTLSSFFKKIPCEIKEGILKYLTNRELTILKGVRTPAKAQP